MLTRKLRALLPLDDLTARFSRSKPTLARAALLGLYLLMTVQFVGCYLFLGHPYIDFFRYSHGFERLPFQTRLLLAPLFRWALESPLLLLRAAADYGFRRVQQPA